MEYLFCVEYLPMHALVDTQHKTDTPFGTGKSVDLNGNHYVVVSTSGEDTFDGGNQFTISSWIKELPDGGWEPWVSKRGESGQGWQLRRYAGNKSMILTIRGPGGDDQLPAGNWSSPPGPRMVKIIDLLPAYLRNCQPCPLSPRFDTQGSQPPSGNSLIQDEIVN